MLWYVLICIAGIGVDVGVGVAIVVTGECCVE